MTRDDLFAINAGIVYSLVEGCAKYCPKVSVPPATTTTYRQTSHFGPAVNVKQVIGLLMSLRTG